MVKWPTYVRLQRQKKIILQRLKVPPSINQFKNTLSKNEAADLFKFLVKYQPEDKAAKKARLSAAASNEAAGGAAASASYECLTHFEIRKIQETSEELFLVDHDPAGLVSIATIDVPW